MVNALPLLQPAEGALLLVDQQARLAFGAGSTDRQILFNNTVALPRRAAALEHPIAVSTSAAKAYSGPLIPAIHTVLPAVKVIERCSKNLWEAAAAA